MTVADYEGKVALVTGGGSGLGRSTALAFAQSGASVMVADLDPEGGKATVTSIRETGGISRFIETDVSDSRSVLNMVTTTTEQFGGLDFAFNNAGIDGARYYALLAEGDEKAFDQVIDINLKGVWLSMRCELAYMSRNGGGAIVNAASLAGLRGMPGFSPYVASKHGVVGLTKTAAIEYARAGIRINAIAPGAIRTPMFDRATASDQAQVEAIAQANPMGRIGEPEEIAATVLWLCSRAAAYITGECVAVDGGYLAR